MYGPAAMSSRHSAVAVASSRDSAYERANVSTRALQRRIPCTELIAVVRAPARGNNHRNRNTNARRSNAGDAIYLIIGIALHMSSRWGQHVTWAYI